MPCCSPPSPTRYRPIPIFCRPRKWGKHQAAGPSRRSVFLTGSSSDRGFAYSAALAGFQAVPTLPSWDLHTFRERAVIAELPVLLPNDVSKQPPAFQSWFERDRERPGSRTLRGDYLGRYGGVIVPLELTRKDEAGKETFERFTAPLKLFVDWMQQQRQRAEETTPTTPTTRLYLAQCQVSDLPEQLRDDLPQPHLVLEAGKGDVYDANLWIGTSPTYTPLHRDPNPNFFLQLAGSKAVRLFPPDSGAEIFGAVQRTLGRDGSARFRGEEMMQGEEKELLERAVWGESEDDPKPAPDATAAAAAAAAAARDDGYQATVEEGNALFIPLGWWHSVKGVGIGTTASVNWWFR